MRRPFRFRLNGFDIFASAAVAGTTALFFGAAINAASLYTSVRPMSGGDRVIGCLGWLIAMFGPISAAIVFWRLSKKARGGWLLHFLLPPLALAFVRIGAATMVSVTHALPDFDDTLGGPVLQALALLILTIVGYYSALIFRFLVRSKPQSDFR